MNMIIDESGAQKCERIGRVRSLVSGRAAFGSSSGATQTFSTPSRGAIHDSHLPSGLRRPCVRFGLPKKALRGISGAATGTTAAGAEAEGGGAAAAGASLSAGGVAQDIKA